MDLVCVCECMRMRVCVRASLSLSLSRPLSTSLLPLCSLTRANVNKLVRLYQTPCVGLKLIPCVAVKALAHLWGNIAEEKRGLHVVLTPAAAATMKSQAKCASMCAYVCTCMCICVYACAYACICVRMCAYVCVCVWMLACAAALCCHPLIHVRHTDVRWLAAAAMCPRS